MATDPDPLRLLISQRSILGFYRVLDTSWREEDLMDSKWEGRMLPSLEGTEWYLVELEPAPYWRRCRDSAPEVFRLSVAGILRGSQVNHRWC